MTTQEILRCLKNVKPTSKGWSARCPAHEDEHNSLSIGEGDGGRLLLRCHAGCTFDSIRAAVGIGPIGARRIVATYDYRDDRGDLLYQSVRYDPKGFIQRRKKGAEWIYQLNGVRRVLYCLPELLSADQSEIVFIVEGEKDVDRLSSLGLVATTNANGAGKWRDEYNEFLIGRRVAVIPDNDIPGHQHAQHVTQSLSAVTASVGILELPNLPLKGDVSDWLDAGGAVEQLKALAEAALVRKPDVKLESRHKKHFTFSTLDDLLAEPEEETAYVWEKTLPCGGFSIIAAKPKAGKSTYARNLAVAVHQGAEFFGRATAQGTVIYLCLEEKRAEVARHFRRMGASGAHIIIHTGSTPSDALEALDVAIEEYSPALIIIDPLSRFVRVADFNSYGEVTRGLEPLIDLARTSKCQCHIMAVHHNGKGEREGGDALLGSTGFFGAVDTLLIMKRRERARTIETIQRYGEDMPETVVHLDPATGLITLGGDMHTLLLKEREKVVLECFEGTEPLGEADVKERISGNQGLTSKAVRALYDEGRLIRTGAGKKGDPYQYRLPSETTEPPDANSGFPLYRNPRNSETPQSVVTHKEWEYPPDLDSDVFTARCAEIERSHHVSQREAARIVIAEHKAAGSI